MAETLDALRFPLWGSRLIEASAGTGKTWTIAALYVRLVLGHGGDASFGRPLQPAEILVMTFTRAATRELSDRIRSRLLDAARCFRGEAQPAPHDPLLTDLLADYPPGPLRSQAAWRLASAAEGMDDAAVHTIDAWCQRMLREHAFDSGNLFDEELAANESQLLAEAARDYWRAQLYPLSGAAWDTAISVWRDIAALTDDARQLREQNLPAGAGDGSLGEQIAQRVQQQAAAVAALKQGWAARAGEMTAWLDAQTALKACPFNKVKLAQRHYTGWLQTLADWAAGDEVERPDLKTGATRLTPQGLQDAVKPGAWVDLPDHFEAFAQLLQALDALPSPRTGLRLHAAARIKARLTELKQQAGSFGFADLLNRLDHALDPAQNGAAAERLRARLLAQYPVALVDEFQDTSPVQARIFDRLYRVADNDSASALLLIGDPKQSIYGFRGADIQSYLGVRQATAGRHYALGTNHRSSAALVAAVNQLFEQAELREGAGAFLFRAEGDALPDNPLPFSPVQARGRPEHLVDARGTVPALSLVLDGHLLDSNSSQRLFAARCAERIVSLLNDPQAGFQRAQQAPPSTAAASPLGADPPQAGFVRLRPADIAVLVRTGREAAAVRRELRSRQVASVYLSDKDSVFDSAEAHDLQRWLAAVASPLDTRLVRAALATRLIGLPLAELLLLARDDEAFDARSELLRQLHGVWQTQGVLSMLRQTLHRLDLPARWLADAASGARVDGPDPGPGPDLDPDGERRLTNVLHLAELLQAASAQVDGEQALIRWLASQIDDAHAAGDEQTVRLESDADLVKVVTVHKSKGLEYPLVFLPFACSFRAVSKARTAFVSPADAAGGRSLVLQPSDAQTMAADRERQREDLRLLYVALTRARHALWLGFAALKTGNGSDCTAWRSAAGYLLCGPDKVAAEQLAAVLRNTLQPNSDSVLQRADAPADIGHSRLQPRDPPTPLRDLQVYAADFERRWSVGSFSGLVRDLAAPSLLALGDTPLRDDEALAPTAGEEGDFRGDFDADGDGEAVEAAAPARPAQPLLRPGAVAIPAGADAQPWHHFARGALAGNFLHDQLEWLAGEGFQLAASVDLQQQLRQRCERQDWGHAADAVVDWLLQAVQTPLPPVGAALAGLGSLLPEMEFWFPSDGLVASQVDALCRRHLLAGRPRPALPERELRGMLMGLADLVFESGGRFWVLDYKSNYLGPQDRDYHADALDAAMAAHRYDVQAALYLLALHRLLRSRLGAAYDPARQLGGAVYFFLRGLQGPASGCVHVAPPLALLDGLDALLAPAAAAAAAAAAAPSTAVAP
jgi:exodeoxyribonuclease V beta subunit